MSFITLFKHLIKGGKPMTVKEYAKLNNKTPQAIYQLMKRHEKAKELSNKHVTKDDGLTILDDIAIEFLDSRIKAKPVATAVLDTETMEELKKLRTENQTLKDAMLVASDKANTYLERLNENILQIAELEKLQLEDKHKNELQARDLKDSQEKNSELLKQIEELNKTISEQEEKIKELSSKSEPKGFFKRLFGGSLTE